MTSKTLSFEDEEECGSNLANNFFKSKTNENLVKDCVINFNVEKNGVPSQWR